MRGLQGARPRIYYLDWLRLMKALFRFAITTDVATTSRGKYPLTELDQVALFKPVTKWNASLDDAAACVVRKAFKQ